MHLHAVVLVLRMAAVVILAVYLTVHVRSVRVFRWEQSASGGVLVTYGLAMVGLALAAGLRFNHAKMFQVYICATGTILLLLNAGGIYRRWRLAGQLTRVVAELLGAMGVPLRRQVMNKVFLSALAGIILFVDLILLVMGGTTPEDFKLSF